MGHGYSRAYMEEAEQSLAALIRHMRDHREYVVVKDTKGPLAYLTLAVRHGRLTPILPICCVRTYRG